MYDFANILFSGPCTARCPFCIGRQVDPRLNQDNLSEFPPRNLYPFIDLIWEHGIRQVVLTGTNTDPQCYCHEERLLDLLREHLPRGAKLSLHTNGRLALKKMGAFNQYDRATLSFPSFNPMTYQRMMGVPDPPNLARIVKQSIKPVKISALVTGDNAGEIPDLITRCHALGIHRMVLRKLFGDPRPWQEITDLAKLDLTTQKNYRGNPVYDHQGMEITLWDFEHTTSSAINLFANGAISDQYLLTKALLSNPLETSGVLLPPKPPRPERGVELDRLRTG